jgi:flagellar biosynthesis chaperone FliJ
MSGAMGRFRFALGSALEAASARERDAALAHARARAAESAARETLALLDARGAQASALAAGSAWLAAEWYRERLRDVRARGDRDVAATRVAALRARERFDLARRTRRALDVLRERRLAEHRAREALHEAAELDESNARRLVRGGTLPRGV